MDNPADLLRYLASGYGVTNNYNNTSNADGSQDAVARVGKAAAASNRSGENTSAAASSTHHYGSSNGSSSNRPESMTTDTMTGNNYATSNTGSNSNNSNETETNDSVSSSEGVAAAAEGQYLQPSPAREINNSGGSTGNNGGFLDPQTRFLLETILRLDNQMKGVVTNSSSSNIDTSMASTTSSGQQQPIASQLAAHEGSTTSTGATATEAKTTGAENFMDPASLMHRESSSTSYSSEEDMIQVPCRARGQPPEHNYITAYFTIKKNEKHGRELVCSFPGCRDGGVKFCYCSYCRVPVARRNFRLRHHHADAKLPVKPRSNASKQKKKAKIKQYKKIVATPSQPQSANLEEDPNAAATMAQAGVMAAAANAATGGDTNAISSLLLQSFAQALKQGQSGAATAYGPGNTHEQHGCSNNNNSMAEHALGNGPTTAMEEISRLGDSSSATSTSDGSSVRIPCRARGMPLDHTIETAYFTISTSIKHGDELVCSHPSCITSGGVKFCWCSFCKIPVAKRNFRIRHHHCDLMQPPNMIAGKTAKKGDSDTPKKRKAKKQDVPSTASEDSDLTTQSPGAEPTRVNDDGENTASSSTTRKKRKKVWSKLLDKFPKAGDDESKKEWLAKVLMVSDKKTRRNELRPDIQPETETKDLAAIYLEKSKKPRMRHRTTEV